jgi:hypothetical protein|eukprot:COSAG02_NODE_121_length_35326_cov_25.450819_3_plen_113_part_00
MSTEEGPEVVDDSDVQLDATGTVIPSLCAVPESKDGGAPKKIRPVTMVGDLNFSSTVGGGQCRYVRNANAHERYVRVSFSLEQSQTVPMHMSVPSSAAAAGMRRHRSSSSRP